MASAPLQTLVSRVVINASPEKVWGTLVKRDEVLPFFFGTVMHTTDMKPGAPIRMRSPDGKYTAVVGDLLDYQPPTRLEMTFKFTTFNDPLCKVTYSLQDTDNGTEFTLTSSDVPPGTKTARQMKAGSEIITSCLKKICETGKPTLKARFIMLMSSLLSFTNPKSSLTSNWPLEKTIE